MKKEIITIIILTVFVCVLGFAGEAPKHTFTRTVILSGKIADKNTNETLAGVKIKCNNVEKSFYSDLDGNFFLSFQVNTSEENKVEFSQVGYFSQVLDVKDLQVNSGNLKIDLLSE
jgi:hypothetical protein